MALYVFIRFYAVRTEKGMIVFMSESVLYVLNFIFLFLLFNAIIKLFSKRMSTQKIISDKIIYITNNIAIVVGIISIFSLNYFKSCNIVTLLSSIFFIFYSVFLGISTKLVNKRDVR